MDRRLIARRLACLALLAVLLAWGGLAQAAPARQDPYPVPEQPTADPLAPLPTPSAYPPPALLPAATPELIGAPFDEQGLVGIVATPTSVPAPPSSQGVLFLWLGFVATLLIFGAAVLGAVMLFTRRLHA
ncbi:MAG: hypothetical protein IPH95_04700 [Candidatus Promineofilum sp.]|nr:hypothetical protein [Promineifilum sp.]